MSECNSDCSSCNEQCSEKSKKSNESMFEKLNPHSKVKKVIGIVSGKGGVGKSLVTALLASSVTKRNKNAAVLDADITGPSVPKMFGINGRAVGTKEGIIPLRSKGNVQVMSINLMLENPTDPVIWRGPIIAGVVKQFWSDVIWDDVDYMFVDMPPGTGDVPLTVFQAIPLDGVVIVSSPQDLVAMIVEKAIHMANMMNIPIIGVVENMSYVKCPNCDEKIYIYGKSHIDSICMNNSVKFLGNIPISEELSGACDSGNIESIDGSFLDTVLCEIENLPVKEK